MRCIQRIALTTTCVLLIAWGTIAVCGPILPKEQITDRQRSLAGVQRVRIDVIPWGAGDPELLGMSWEKIRARVHKRLTAGGFEVTTERDPDTAQIVLKVAVLTEGKVPEGVTYAYNLSVERLVRIEGVEERLEVPTFFVSYVGLEHRDEVSKVAALSLDGLIDSLIRSAQKARILPDTISDGGEE